MPQTDTFSRQLLIALCCATLLVILSMGMRQGFGVFVTPISTDLGTGRESFGLAIALQNLAFGLASPLIGALADRFGPLRVIVLCSLAQLTGMTLSAMLQGTFSLYSGIGLLVGLGQAGTTYAIVLGVIARLVPSDKRTLMFGIVTAAGSFGMFAMVHVSQQMLELLSWRDSLVALGGLVGIGCALAALGLNHPAPQRSVHEQTLSETWRKACRHRGYLLLNAGFFVCGFQVTFVGTHLTGYLQDGGLTAATAAQALALIGLLNMAGSLFFGWCGDRFRKKYVLSMLYAARTLLFTVFLLLPLSDTTALAFAAILGFLWLGTVPLTSGLVGELFGIRYLATLYGVVFLGHQLGSFSGAWAGGWIYDQTGNYDAVWVASIALGVTATLLHWLIPDQPESDTPTIAKSE